MHTPVLDILARASYADIGQLFMGGTLVSFSLQLIADEEFQLRNPGADPGINLTIAQIDMATFGRGICTVEAGNGGIRGRIPNFRESTLIK